jgi:hypothetical protein
MKKKTKLELTPEQVKKITDFVMLKRSEGMDDKHIRKEIFKKFELDITLYKLDWRTGKAKKGAVHESKALVTTHDQKRTKEPTTFKYNYSEQEINEFGRSLSNIIQEQNDLEEQKKNVVADYKIKIDAKQTQINDLSRKINIGFTMKNEVCDVIKDFAAGTKKAYLNSKLVLDERLTAADYTLPFPTQEEVLY